MSRHPAQSASEYAVSWLQVDMSSIKGEDTASYHKDPASIVVESSSSCTVVAGESCYSALCLASPFCYRDYFSAGAGVVDCQWTLSQELLQREQ